LLVSFLYNLYPQKKFTLCPYTTLFRSIIGVTQSIIKQTLSLVEELGIANVYVYHVGDIIEHLTMRNVNQAFDSEFTATEQIAKRSEEHTSELQSRFDLVCRLLLEKKKQ